MEYSLQATISHIGSTTDSGHYYTHIKASDGLWYRINDEEVDLVDEFDVVNNYSTYLLFYVVTDAHWTPSYFLNGPEVPVVWVSLSHFTDTHTIYLSLLPYSIPVNRYRLTRAFNLVIELS